MTSIKYNFCARTTLLTILWIGMAGAQASETKLMVRDAKALDEFGLSVSVSGNYALVGSWLGDDTERDGGTAYVFYYDGSAWVQQVKLTGSEESTHDYFGYSVSLSGDDALIGEYGWHGNTGSAFIFHFDGSGWVQQGKLTASDSSGGSDFGRSVSLLGDYALVGAPLEGHGNRFDAGSAYVFHYDGSSWNEQAKLIASDGQDFDSFGSSVSMSGDFALIGASGDDDNGAGAGSAYIFHFDGLNWIEQAKMMAGDGVAFDSFGSSVSLSGDFALIGAYLHDAAGSNSGAAYVFHYDGSNWGDEVKLTASNGATDDQFGHSVSLSGDRALIGSKLHNAPSVDAGSAYLYHYNGSAWAEEFELTSRDAAAFDQFGCAVSLSDDYALVGAIGDDDVAQNAGSAYVFSGLVTPISPVAVTVEIDSTDIPLPPEGGDVSFALTVTNETPDSVVALLSCETHDPNGSIHSLFHDRRVVLEGFGVRHVTGTFHVPAGGSAGTYTLLVPWEIRGFLYSVSASFEKLPAGMAKDESKGSETKPNEMVLSNYSNPFNPTTSITYSIGEAGPVKLTVYNTLGQLVTTLVDSPSHPAGQFTARFNASGLASGVYLYRLETAGATEVKRMLLTK